MAGKRMSNERDNKEQKLKRSGSSSMKTGGGSTSSFQAARVEEVDKSLFFQKNDSQQSRLLDIWNYYLILNTVALILYGSLTGFRPANACLASIFGLTGLICISLALKSQLKFGDSLFSGLSPSRAYLEFVLAGVCVLLGAFTFLG